jgi:hypothetical protein
MLRFLVDFKKNINNPNWLGGNAPFSSRILSILNGHAPFFAHFFATFMLPTERIKPF